MRQRREPAAPITADRLASRREHLMTEILQTPEPLPTKPFRAPRRTIRLAVAGLTVAALTVGVSVYANTGGGPTGNGPAAFAIERLPSGPVRITIVDTEASARQMTKQLHAEGLDISITTMPANAQVVGEWLTFSSTTSNDPADQALLGQEMTEEPSVIDVPRGLLGAALNFGIARAAKPGEKLEVAGIRNALRPAGPLFCLRLVGTTPVAAGRVLTAAGYTVRFDSHAGDFRSATVRPPAGLVVQAYIWDPVLGIPGTPHDVYVTVRDPASATYPAFAWLGWPTAMKAGGVRDYSGCPAS